MDGTIRSFDAADGLGWIELDDHQQIRFGLRACKGFPPVVGARVRVGGVQEVRGKLKATSVEPVLDHYDVEEQVWPEARQEFCVERRWEQGEERSIRIRRTLFDQHSAYRVSPKWPAAAAFAQMAITPAKSEIWTDIATPSPHPFFEPWHSGICETAVPALNLVPLHGTSTTASRMGGDSARMVRPWPHCTEGHGSMTLVMVIEARDLTPMVGSSMRLVIHACPPCLRADRHVWLGRGAGASVAWCGDADGELRREKAKSPLPETKLHARPILSFPPSWLFFPRQDVEGHGPVEGVAASLLSAKLLRETEGDSQGAYEDASFAYDRHYLEHVDLLVGGYSRFRFGLCPSCKKPLQQIVHLSDYFTGGAFPDLFDGRNELTLLACDRTPTCGGPECGLLVLDP